MKGIEFLRGIYMSSGMGIKPKTQVSKIDFYTFRYWRATMDYRRLHDFGAVMILLGHKSLKYVLLYAQLSDAYEPNGGYV
jgi:hypothetical protein